MITPYRRGERVRILGVPFRIHGFAYDRDVVYVYTWRDTVARPISGTAFHALADCL